MITKVSRKDFGQLAEAILEIGAKQATRIYGEKLTLKATRQGRLDKRSRQTTILFTIGRPNYAERQFIKSAKAAGEPFPIKRVLLKYDPKRKAA